MELDADGNLKEEDEGWETTEKERHDMDQWFKTARAGDHLLTTFLCNLCHFRNIFKRDPVFSSREDEWVMLCITRANLDAFWARRSSTVKGNLMEVNRLMKILKDLRIENPCPDIPRGPFPLADTLGMIPAIISLQRSMDRGRNSKTIQWDTMRGIRSGYNNLVHTTPKGTDGAVMSDGRNSTHITTSPTNSLWFKKFMIGSHERMGDVKIQDAAVSIDLLLALQDLLEKEWKVAEENNRGYTHTKFEIVTLGAALMLGFSSALRGEELGHVRLCKTRLYTEFGLKHPTRPHVVLALQGRFKNTTAYCRHKIPLVPVSKSGIRNAEWLLRLLELYSTVGEAEGPLFRWRPRFEQAISIRELDVMWHKTLHALQIVQSSLVPDANETGSSFSFRRSLRRGSTTQARNQKVPKDVITINNRWRSQDRAGNRFAQTDMLEVYTDVIAALKTLLQYSEAL